MPVDPLTAESACPRAARSLNKAANAMGFVPNLLGVMAHSPAVLESYMSIAGLFDTTSLSPEERQIVLLTVSQHNGCDYCKAAHTAIAAQQGVCSQAVDAAKSGQPIDDIRLEALRQFTLAMLESAGRPTDAQRQAFRDEGFTEANILDVILGITMKTLSNYTSHITAPAIDPQFHAACTVN